MADGEIAVKKLAWDKLASSFVEATQISHASKGEPFLRGPVPIPWLASAAQLPGKTLHVGIMLWFMAGILKRQDQIKVPKRIQESFGVARWAYSDALDRLALAGLVSVLRQGKQSPVVTILSGEGLVQK